MLTILQRVLKTPLPPTTPQDFTGWWPWYQSQHQEGQSALERAFLGGLYSERVAFAFASGYQAALQTLFLGLSEKTLAALCATEEGGAHPKAIQTTLTPSGASFLLSGHKTFVTLLPAARLLFVVASVGREEEKNRLSLVRVNADALGVTLTQMPPFSFIPEVSHGEARFQEVKISAEDILPGDGYELYLKPFRTIEDIYVHAALLGHLIGVARRYHWPESFLEEALAISASLSTLAGLPASAPEVHLALAGVLSLTRKFLRDNQAPWALCPQEVQERWQRDQRLLQIAEKVRVQRTESAWRKLLPK